MLGTTMAVVGGVASLGSAVAGAIKSSQVNDRARKLIQQQRDDNKAWYQRKMSEDYTMRSDNQAVINKQRELAKELYKQSAARNIVAGGTDESLALQQEAANKSISETMQGIAANAANYKDSVEQQYLQQDAALNQQQVQDEFAQGAATAQAAGQAVNAGLNLMGTGLGKDAGAKATKQAAVDAKVAEFNQFKMPKIKA